MKKPQAANQFVLVKRDKTENETSGLLIPDSGRVKPHTGEIFSVGPLVQDDRIKDGKKALWHKTVGFDIDYDGETYLVLLSSEIIAVI